MKWLNDLSRGIILILNFLEKYGLDIPETSVPGINILLELGKWAKKREVPLTILSELCHKYKIEIKEINSFEDLNKMGVPTNEIDHTLYKAKARIDFPSLIRYLQSSEKIANKKFDELLVHFSKFSEALRGPYLHLLPIEIVLQTPPKTSDFAEPIFFRKTGPVAADIEGQKVYSSSTVDKILENLQENPALLLHGIAATGKTVKSRIVAYRYYKAGKKVRFVQLKTQSIDLFTLKEETIKFGIEEPDSLLVIEDAHLKMNLINEFLSWRTKDWPKLLITSRNDVPEIHSQAFDNFTSLFKLVLSPFESADEIISMFYKDKNWELSKSLKSQILLCSEGSLWVLSYALKSLEDSIGKIIHKESIKNEVQKDLEDIALTDSLFPRLLIALSVLYRYEIPTDIRFLYHRFRESNYILERAIKALVRFGEVIQLHSEENYFYGLPHSSLGELYFQFSKYPQWEEEAIYGSETEFISEYAVSEKATNAIDIKTIIKKQPILYQEIIKKLDPVKLSQRMLECDHVFLIGDYIDLIFKGDRNKAREIVKGIDKNRLVRKIPRDYSVFDVLAFIYSFLESDLDAARELFHYLDKEELSGRILEIKDFLEAKVVIDCISEIDSKEAIILLKSILELYKNQNVHGQENSDAFSCR